MEKEAKTFTPVGTVEGGPAPTHSLEAGSRFYLPKGKRVWSVNRQKHWTLSELVVCVVTATCVVGDLVFFSIDNYEGQHAAELPDWKPARGIAQVKKQPREKEPSAEDVCRGKLEALIAEHGIEAVYEAAGKVVGTSVVFHG